MNNHEVGSSFVKQVMATAVVLVVVLVRISDFESVFRTRNLWAIAMVSLGLVVFYRRLRAKFDLRNIYDLLKSTPSTYRQVEVPEPAPREAQFTKPITAADLRARSVNGKSIPVKVKSTVIVPPREFQSSALHPSGSSRLRKKTVRHKTVRKKRAPPPL